MAPIKKNSRGFFFTAGITFTSNYIPKQTISHTHESQVLTSHNKIPPQNFFCSTLDIATIKMCVKALTTKFM